MYKVGDEVLVKAMVDDVTDGYVRVYAQGYGAHNFKVNFAGLVTKTYTQGLADAWELAKKIRVQSGDGGIPLNEIENIFGTVYIDTIFKNNTYAEALAKIEAYEKEKEIKVKTIVETRDGSHKGVVTLVREKGDFFVLWDNGTSDTYEKHEVKNTGKKAESLDLLLRQIGE